jgi:CRP/FNR family transcriptional regulator
MPQTIQLSPLSTLSGRSQVKCGTCALNKLCLPMGLDEAGTVQLDKIIKRRRVDRDENLFRMDEPFKNLYAVRFGHFKTFRINPSGEQQVVGFQMAGDVLGMDAIGAQRHHSAAVALEDSEVCEIPFAQFEQLSAELPHLQRHFYRVMGHEISREQSAMLFLGGMRAEQKFAVFLLNLSVRYAARGYSPLRFQLRMSREAIGNYLGLTIESVSRLLLRFKQKGLMRIDKREVEITDRSAMEALATGHTLAEPIASRVRQPRASMYSQSYGAAA